MTGGELVGYAISALISILVEVVAIEPLIRTMLLEIDYPGVSEGVLHLVYLVFVVGSVLGMWGAISVILDKVQR